MPYSEKEQKPGLSRKLNSQNEARSMADLSAFGLPNSLMENMFSDDSGGNPAGSAVIQRQFGMPHRQIPSAEAEADKLSEGVSGKTPDSIRSEMGGRLNADLSGIRFHSDAASKSRAERMGARAWTSGGDIYFGEGGFEPRIAAHELVHTVQQGAVRGSVRQNVAAGTVQMWSLWPFGKKKSKYDEIQSPSEEADFLFRTQAGISAVGEKQDAERDEVYENTYRKEIRNNRSAKNAERIARNKKNRLKTSSKSIISKSDQTKYSDTIRSVSFDTYKEVVLRRDEEAEKLVSTYKDLYIENYEKEKSAASAANSVEGRNYRLYNSIVQNIELEHSGDPEFSQWKKRIRRDSGKKAAETEKIRSIAFEIINLGKLSDDNKYLKTDEGMRSRTAADKENEQYFKDIYAGKQGPKKKTKLDRMADYYRQSNFGRVKKISLDNESESGRKNTGLIGLDDPRDNIIRNDTGNDIILNNKISDDDSLSEKGMKEKDGDINTDTFMNNGMKEKDDDSFDNYIGSDPRLNEAMIDYGDESFSDLISNSAPDKGGNGKDILDLAVEDAIGRDTDEIVHQGGLVTDELANNYIPSNSIIGKGKTLSSKIDYYNSLGKTGNSLAQIGLIANNIDIKTADNLYTDIISPAAGGATGLIGGITGASGFVTGIHDIRRNFHNVEAGGARSAYINSGLDTLASGSAMAAGGMAAMQNASSIPVVGNTLASIGNAGGANVIPGLNIATGAATAFTGAYEGIKGQRSINKIDDQIEALKQTEPEVKDVEDQAKLMKIFRQSRRVAELRRTGNFMKFLGGGITAGTGIALLTGPLAPLTLAILGAAGAGVGIAKYFYGKKKKKNLRKDVTAEEMGIDWKTEVKRVKRMFKDENLSTREARAIILKGHGYEEGTRTAAFKQINQDRSKTLMDSTRKGGRIGDMAKKVISALGVHRKKGRYAEGAEKLLAEKLSS